MWTVSSSRRVPVVDEGTALNSVEHHGVQPTGCMDNEPEPSRGVPC